MNTPFKKILCFYLLVVSSCDLPGCHSNSQVSQNPSTATSMAASSTSPCGRDPFLQKYNCSVDQIEEAAEQGDADAEYAYGYLNFYGIGTTRDIQTGLAWIRKAAGQGQPLAIAALNLINEKQFPQKGGTVFHKPQITKKRI